MKMDDSTVLEECVLYILNKRQSQGVRGDEWPHLLIHLTSGNRLALHSILDKLFSKPSEYEVELTQDLTMYRITTLTKGEKETEDVILDRVRVLRGL